MQKLFSIFLFLILTTLGYSQNSEKLLLNSYSKQELELIKTTEPEKYDLLLFAIDHGTYLGIFDSEKHSQLKLKELPDLTEKPIFTDIQVKIMPYNQYFYAPKMNKIVIVKSEWVLKNEKLTEK